MRNYTFCEDVVGDIDWTLSHKLQKDTRRKTAITLKTWHQAALVTHGDGNQYKKCPYCQELATPVHLIWLCKWTNEKVGELPMAWRHEIEAGAVGKRHFATTHFPSEARKRIFAAFWHMAQRTYSFTFGCALNHCSHGHLQGSSYEILHFGLSAP